MDPLWIVLVGVVIVIGGVLIFRLHAFLALILAAMVVAGLTPRTAVERFHAERDSVPWVMPPEATSSEPGTWVLDLSKKKDLRAVSEFWVLRKGSGGELTQVTQLEVSSEAPTDDLPEGQRVAISADAVEPLEGDVVIHPLDWSRAQGKAKGTLGERVAAAFGGTCTQIAILIAMASIIGKCLLDSGAADRIIRAALSLVGEGMASIAFITSGFVLSIPVFFDTVFYLMIPLAKALRLRTGKNYLLYVLSVIVGGTMAHSLVPPTPGPLIVIEQFNVDIGLMILAGCCVGFFTSTAGYFYAVTLNHYWDLPLRETPDMTLDDIQKIVERKTDELPPLWLSLMPILLPVFLISGYTILKVMKFDPATPWMQAAEVLGNKNIALTIAAAIGLAMVAWQLKGDTKKLATAVAAALASGGIVILITAAGGAFGTMLRETGIAEYLSQVDTSSPITLLAIAYFLTMAIRTAQGSSTVAMITSAGILSGVASPDVLGFHPVYLALAVGCGSKPIAWMNDSGFWVMCKMSGMTDIEGLKAITPMSLFISLVGLAVTMLGAILLPLV